MKGGAMNLREALQVAERTVGLFGGFCERLVVAGSVRRKRPVCNDLDLVCVPKFAEERDLLGVVSSRRNLLREALVEFVDGNRDRYGWVNGGAPEVDGVNLFVRGQRCKVEFYCTSEEWFATALLTRTGSREHNIWIAERARARGGRFMASEGLLLPGGRVFPRSEEEFYSLLGLPFIEPVRRERFELARIELEVGR